MKLGLNKRVEVLKGLKCIRFMNKQVSSGSFSMIFNYNKKIFIFFIDGDFIRSSYIHVNEIKYMRVNKIRMFVREFGKFSYGINEIILMIFISMSFRNIRNMFKFWKRSMFKFMMLNTVSINLVIKGNITGFIMLYMSYGIIFITGMIRSNIRNIMNK